MANQTQGFGFRQAPTMGSTPATGGQAEYKIKPGLAVGIFQNDPVSPQHTAGDDGYLQDITAATMDDGITGGTGWANTTSNIQKIIGVFNGAFFIDSNGKPTFSNNVVASQATSIDYNTGSNDIIAFINDNPNQEYVVKADAALADTLLGVNPMQGFNTNNYTATDNKDGQSITTLDVGSAAATSMFTVVRSANDPENKDQTAPGCNFVVTIMKGSALYN